MPQISKIKICDNIYEIKDSELREAIEILTGKNENKKKNEDKENELD